MNVSRRAFVVALLMGAAALSAAPAGEAKPALRAGAAAVDITPEPGINIHGVIMRGSRMEGAHDRLHARSLALDDGTTRLVLTICDVRMIGRRVCDEAKQLVSQRTGIPASHLLIAATHTHATPTPVDLFDDEPYTRWQQVVIERVAESMTQAVNNLAPARLGRASMRKPDYTFNRRWKLRDDSMPPNPFGEKTDGVLTNPGGRRDKLLEPAGPVDDELSVLSVQHADGRPLALLANYSTHYVGGYAGALVSSDYYGVFSERVKQALAPTGDPAFVAMMFNGTSGDVNTQNFAAPPDTSPPWTRIKQIGEDMAAAAVGLLKSIEYTSDVKLAAAVRELELGVRKPDAARLEWAKSVLAKGKPPGWTGIYAAEALELAKYPDRVKLIVQAMRIGDLGITAMPCEVFAETGLDIKKRSPIQPTLNISLANGYNGYLPTPEQHALSGYETWPARSSYLEAEAASKMRDAVLELLAQVR